MPHTTLLWLAFCAPAFAWQGNASEVKRIYVEKFATKADAQKLTADVTAELRKLNSVSVVSNESAADFVLGGGGEIWIKGYRSFSPRSHMKMPSNGTPIFGGYLSVELKSKSGVTLWSDLVTPGAEPEDVSKDLSKRIVKDVAESIGHLESLAPAAPARTEIDLKGAGATLPYPVYSKWFTNYHAENPGVRLDYDAVGSEAGVRRLLAGTVDFAASDCPTAIHELSPGAENNYLFFPSVIGALVPIVNLPGLSEDIHLTAEALSGIYLGTITKWNDPILKRANRGLDLPDLHIVVIHRADGSGTSYAWTDYLSKVSPEWKARVGASLTPKWPKGRSATGNDGVAKLVKELGGSIGYVEFIYALQNHLSYGKVRNQNGEFVEASLETIAAAVGHVNEIRDDFAVSIVDAPGPGAYPISTFTWLVVPSHIADEKKREAISAFLRWMLGPGQRQAAALGYLALPKEFVTKEEDGIARIH